MTQKRKLLATIDNVLKTNDSSPNVNMILDVEKRVLDYLKIYPKDTDIWIKLALVEYVELIHDDIRAMEYLNTVLQYDPHNIIATLLFIYIKYHFSYLEKEEYELLLKLKTDSKKLQALIEYAKAFYYFQEDEKEKYEQALRKSIAIYDKYVFPQAKLAKYIIKKGENKEAKRLLLDAIKNIKKVYDKKEFVDFTDSAEFIAESYEGTHMSKMNYQNIHGTLNSTS